MMLVINPLTPQSYLKHLISSYSIIPESHKGCENKGNDHQLKRLLIVKQILLDSTLGNIWRTLRRIWILMHQVNWY